MAVKSHENQRSPRPKSSPSSPPRLPFGSGAIGPGLTKNGSILRVRVTQSRPPPPLLSKVVQDFCSECNTLGAVTLPVCGSIAPVLFPKESSLSVQQNNTNQNLNYLDLGHQEVKKAQPNSNMVWPWRSNPRTVGDTSRSLSTHSQLPLLVTPPTLPSSTSSFRSWVPGQSSRILTAVLKGRFYYIFDVLQINKSGFRVFYYMLLRVCQRTWIATQVPETRL